MIEYSITLHKADLKTLIECKNEVALKYGYATWRDVDFYPESENAKTNEPPYFKERLHDEASELYANQFRILAGL